MLHFQLPIIGDGLIWNNPENRREGYKLKRGKKIIKLMFKKISSVVETYPRTEPLRYGRISAF
jgi:hypothetical protein